MSRGHAGVPGGIGGVLVAAVAAAVAAFAWQAPAGASALSPSGPAGASALPAGAVAAVSPAASATHQAALDGVSCPAVNLCIAVGGRLEAHGRAPLAERWNGSSWRVLSMPAAPASASSLFAVSCPTTTDCTAVGQAASSQTNVVPLAEQWNGHAWRVTQSRNPAGTKDAALEAVSCASKKDCVAVGYWQDGSNLKTVAEKWNGHSWSLQRAAKLPRTALLAGVHCEGSFCMAVGQRENASRTLVTMAEEWTGHAWTVLSVPAPAGANFSTLQDVWCTSDSSCFAVGQYQGTIDSAIADAWNGSAWSQQPISAVNDILYGIACHGPASCMAVGAGLTRPVSQQWTGAAWHAIATARVSGAPFAFLVQVSCPTATRCIAVGARTNGSPVDIGVTLAEEWNGSSWSVLKTVNP